jgi:hypothetical protein
MDVLRRPNEGNLDEARQQATAAPLAAEKKALDVAATAGRAAHLRARLRLVEHAAGTSPSKGDRYAQVSI